MNGLRDPLNGLSHGRKGRSRIRLLSATAPVGDSPDRQRRRAAMLRAVNRRGVESHGCSGATAFAPHDRNGFIQESCFTDGRTLRSWH